MRSRAAQWLIGIDDPLASAGRRNGRLWAEEDEDDDDKVGDIVGRAGDDEA